MPTITRPRLGAILGEESKEDNVPLSPLARSLLDLFRQEFRSQIRAGQEPRFYTGLHWCRAALGVDCPTHQMRKGRRELKRGGYITLDQGNGRWNWQWAAGVVSPGPRLAEEIRAQIERRDGGGA